MSDTVEISDYENKREKNTKTIAYQEKTDG